MNPDRAVSARWYVLFVLMVVYVLNIADRYVVSTLIEPIKADLHLSDSAIGFLTGVALAIFYVTAGLPLAVLADRTNRRTLVALSLAAWSLMTVACGLTRTFGQLMWARIFVGIGEAGGTPASHSLVSDYFSWERRAFALSILSVGVAIGSMVGSSAGYVSDALGWRAAFIVLGVPGVLFACVILLTVKEPQRGRLDRRVATQDRPALRTTLRYILTQRALAHTLIGGALFNLWARGLMWWAPSYLVRSHHMSLGAAGGALALMHGIGGTAVLLLSAVCMARFATADPRAVPWFTAAIVTLATVPSIIAFSTTSTSLAIGMLWLFIPMSYACFGPVFGLCQNLVPAHMRSQSSAILIFVSNIANLMLAPQLVGLASDALEARYGAESLRMALVPLSFVGFWTALHFWYVARDLREGLVRAGNGPLA
jgi:MFS family permease